MKIRSITYFYHPAWPLDEKALKAASAFLGEAKAGFIAAGFEVQTTRLACTPFPRWVGTKDLTRLPDIARSFEADVLQAGIDYLSLGPALPEVPQSYAVIPEAIAATENAFFSGLMTGPGNDGLSLAAVHACAEVIARCAPLTPDGFANLRFAALANVPPGAPFFPAAYHEGDDTAFAIATEAADLAVRAFTRAKTVDEGRAALTSAVEEQARRMCELADFLKFKFSTRFGGIDFSLAPFPDEALSLGAAVERLGVPKVGLHGSLAAAAILTEAVERADFPHVGFSGFMQPVLEDAILAQRAAEGTLTVKDLLLFSTVCGTGLDTVPLPGDTSPAQLAALLLDLSALALRLDKPLTARLMPIPGKKIGDPTEFDFGYFANSRVMSLEAQDLTHALGGSKGFSLGPRGEA